MHFSRELNWLVSTLQDVITKWRDHRRHTRQMRTRLKIESNSTNNSSARFRFCILCVSRLCCTNIIPTSGICEQKRRVTSSKNIIIIEILVLQLSCIQTLRMRQSTLVRCVFWNKLGYYTNDIIFSVHLLKLL